jgi:hypothetical protein
MPPQRCLPHLFLGVWGTWGLVALFCALAVLVDHRAMSNAVAICGAVLFGLVGIGCLLYAWRVLRTAVMVTDSTVVIRGIRTTRTFSHGEVACFEPVRSYVLPRATSASIALRLESGSRLKLVAFEKFPRADSWLASSRTGGSSYWDSTVAALNELQHPASHLF